jgi:hypothetical protein
MNQWTEDARVVFKQWITGKKKLGSPKFRFDQFVKYSKQYHKLEDPPHPNYIGILATWAQNEGLIVWTGEVHASRNTLSKNSIVKVWSVV